MSVRFSASADNASPRRRTPASARTGFLSAWPFRVPVASLCLMLLLGSGPPPESLIVPAVRPGIDVWIDRGLEPLRGKRIGLITNTTGRSVTGRLTAEVLADRSEVDLVALLTPEHAFAARAEGAIGDSVHGPTGLPVFSLYGETRRPTAEMLRGLDGLVFDVQDIGTRFYTYATTLAYAMEEAGAAGIPVVVLDRPNPIGGVAVQGPVLDPELRHFIGYGEVPIRHGMTIGELARLFAAERPIDVDLTVIPASGWRRSMWFDETGLLWVDPSPNIRNLTQALLYPAVGPLEWSNVSVGRGTDAPFEWLGAPWIDSLELAAELAAAGLPGISFVPRRLTPSSGPHADEECGGVSFLILDRRRFDAGLTAAALATTLHRLYPTEWTTERMLHHWGDPEILAKLADGWSAATIKASWETELAAFRDRRQPYLLYD